MPKLIEILAGRIGPDTPSDPALKALVEFIKAEGDPAALLAEIPKIMTASKDLRVVLLPLKRHLGSEVDRLVWLWLVCLTMAAAWTTDEMRDCGGAHPFEGRYSLRNLAKSIGVNRTLVWQSLRGGQDGPSPLERLGVKRFDSAAWPSHSAIVPGIPHLSVMFHDLWKEQEADERGCLGTLERKRPPETWLQQYPITEGSKEALAFFLRNVDMATNWVLVIQGPEGFLQVELARAIFRSLGVPICVTQEEDRVIPGFGWIYQQQSRWDLESRYRMLLEHRYGPSVVLLPPPEKEEGAAAAADRTLKGLASLTVRTLDPASTEYAAWVQGLAKRSRVLLDLKTIESAPLATPETIRSVVGLMKDLRGEAHQEEAAARYLQLLKASVEPSKGFGRLTQSVKPVATLQDLVLGKGEMEQIRQVCAYIKLSGPLLDQWGLRNGLLKHPLRNFLFHGPSGTGKSMAAEAIAHELGMPMRLVDTSRIVGQYYGETENALREIFGRQTPGEATPVLLFDEADGFLMNRGERAPSEHVAERQWTNLLLNYLERYEGVVIMTTNLAEDLDPAIMRRLAMKVAFKAPDVAERLVIWQALWSDMIPTEGEVDLEALATEFRISGGVIRQAFVAACARAASHGAMTQLMLIKACEHALIEKPGHRMGFTLSHTK